MTFGDDNVLPLLQPRISPYLAESLPRKNAMENRFQGLFWLVHFLRGHAGGMIDLVGEGRATRDEPKRFSARRGWKKFGNGAKKPFFPSE